MVRAACGEASSVTGDDVEPGEPAGEVGRLGHGRRRQDEHRVGAVVRADAAQPAQDVRDVRAEHAAVVVALVDHHVAQPAEQPRPPSVAPEGSSSAACRGWSARSRRGRGPRRARRGCCRRRRSPRGRAPRPDASRRRWSAASALVGARYRTVGDRWPCRALPERPPASASSAGTWNTSDLPDAVPVETTTCRPSCTCRRPSAWWAHSSVAPSASNTARTRGLTQSGQGSTTASRAGTRSTWVTRSPYRVSRSAGSTCRVSQTDQTLPATRTALRRRG